MIARMQRVFKETKRAKLKQTYFVNTAVEKKKDLEVANF